MQSLNLCDVTDVNMGAACGTGRSGRVEEIGGSLLCDAAQLYVVH